MKTTTKKIIHLLLAVMQMQIINAQCPDTSTVSTNIDNPINTQFDVSHPGLVNPYLNAYNWAGISQNGFQSILLNPNANWGAGYNTFLMFSPFSSSMGNDYSYLKYINGQYPTIAQLPELDWGWERGWELMWMNTGYYPDGQEINNPQPNSIVNSPIGLTNELTPYIIVYNRYTGKMRLFANLITPFGSTNNIYSTFTYNKQADVSGIFRNLNNYDRPLDMPTINLGATVYNKNDNNNALWYSNDVQLGYDPCVCSYATNINLQLKGIQDFNVRLYGREVQVEVPINQIETNFLNQSSIDVNGANGNNLIYKYTDKLYADYQQQLADYNTKLKDYNSIGNMLKSEVLKISENLTNGIVNAALPTRTVRDFIIKNAVTIKGKTYPGDTTTAEGWAKSAKEASKGLVGKGFDYLSQQFITSKPTAPSMPTATLSEMRISGYITQSNLIQITGLHTPGSFKPSIHPLQPNSYPIYNKPVGLFALLQKPEIELFNSSTLLPDEVIGWDTCITKSINGFGQVKLDTTFNAPKTKVYKMKNGIHLKFKESLVYKYNDASGIDKEKTQTFVSFIIEYDGDNTYTNGYKINSNQRGVITEQGNRILTGNLERMHENILLNNNNFFSRTFESEWINIKEVNQKVFGIEFLDSIINEARGNLNSTIGNTCNFSVYSWVWKQETDLKIKSIKMKLMSDIYFTTNIDMNTTQVFTYKIYDRVEPETQVSELTEVDGISSIKKYELGTIQLTNQHITASHPLVTQVNGTNLVINVERGTISGTLTVDPGFSLLINAQDNIVINPEAEIGPEVELQPFTNFFSTPKFTELPNSELENYCSGINKKYNAQEVALSKKQNNESLTNIVREILQVGIYPNPASTSVQISLEEPSSGVIELYDLLGKLIISKSITNERNLILDVNELENGIFVLHANTNKGSKSQKIIIQH